MEYYFYSVVMLQNTHEPFLTTKKLSMLLEKRNVDLSTKEEQIRKAIKAIRKTLVSIFGTDAEQIIETAAWNGYRLNPQLIKLG